MPYAQRALHLTLLLLPCFLPGPLLSAAHASVEYVFNVTDVPPETFHQPFSAELTVSDAAVAAGSATGADIESLRITAGTAISESNPLTLEHGHPAFVNLAVTFSESRDTIRAISAEITPHMAPNDYWLLYQSTPEHPTLDIHENLGYVAANYIRLETTLLPVPPTTTVSTFGGQWERAFDCRICQLPFVRKFIACFPWCPLPWLMMAMIILVAVGIWRLRARTRA